MSSYWRGFYDHFREQVTENVAAAADELRDELKTVTGIQGPPRSTPGNPPHMDTTELNQTITVIGPADQGDMVIASVGSPVKQARFTELGTQKMAPRPWLAPTLERMKPQLVKTITRGLGQPAPAIEAVEA